MRTCQCSAHGRNRVRLRAEGIFIGVETDAPWLKLPGGLLRRIRRVAAHFAGCLGYQIEKTAHARPLSSHGRISCFYPILLAVFKRSTSFKVSARNCPGGTSSVSGP